MRGTKAGGAKEGGSQSKGHLGRAKTLLPPSRNPKHAVAAAIYYERNKKHRTMNSIILVTCPT